MDEATRSLLDEDIQLIREGLRDFDAYSFAQDVQSRMEVLCLSAPAVGIRCQVSHTIVDRWRQGKAKPNGKERLKELGMALGMDEEGLNAFLYRNGYPKLYAKNPLDGACKLLLRESAGHGDIVSLYRELVVRLNLQDYAPPREIHPLSTQVISQALSDAASEGHISVWLRKFEKNFAGGAKAQAPDLRIAGYLLLYLGDASIYELAVTGELPASLKGLLYPLLAGKAVTMRGLREKLLAFGLCCDMSEEELDVLMEYAKIRPFSDPQTKMDYILLTALRCAHARYPLYEAEGFTRIVRRLAAQKDAFSRELLAQYRPRFASAKQRADYYESRERAPEELLFEQCYTAYSDRGIMDYMRDILSILCEEKDISPNQAKPILDLIQRTQEGASIWN
ncbi:MAG: hypothetical protein VB049_12325 [Candidatus Pelethousia sp.]|nr:hypothetical protein [Candidatus Pelethousia sp.]